MPGCRDVWIRQLPRGGESARSESPLPRRPGLGLRIGPVEPLRQRLDVRGLDRGAAPHAQARRGVAVGGDVVGDALALERRRQRLGETRLPGLGQRRHGRVDHAQAHGGVGLDLRALGQVGDPGGAPHPGVERRGVAVRAAHQPVEPADRPAPFQRVDVVLDAEHRRRVDRVALEDALDQLAPRHHPEDLRQRPGRREGQEALDGARGQHDHAVGRLAAHGLLPGEGHDIEPVPRQALCEGRRGGVADRQAGAVRRDRGALRHAAARRGAVPGEDHIAVEIDLPEVDDPPVGGSEDAGVGEAELLHGVRHPGFAEGLPGQHVHGAGAEQVPHRHLDRAGVGGRHDADAVLRRHLQHLAGEVDGAGELGAADGRAVRAAEGGVAERVERPAGALGAGAGGEAGVRRPAGRGGARHRVPSGRGPPAGGRRVCRGWWGMGGWGVKDGGWHAWVGSDTRSA